MNYKKSMKRMLLLTSLFLIVSFCSNTYALEKGNDDKAIVFALDTSGSMKTNDPDRLAIDSIMQMIYTLTSDYRVGFIAYNSEITMDQMPLANERRNEIMKMTEAIQYAGYSNAGEGLKKAVEFLSNDTAEEKHIVLLSDGEILLKEDADTQASKELYQNAIRDARERGIVIHVIGLGDEMEDMNNAIFQAGEDTGGRTYYTPQAIDIQNAIDSILEEELAIKQSTIAMIDSSGEQENISIELPYAYASKVRILLTSTAPIQNLNTNFQADSANQINGERYSLIEMNEPYGKKIDLSFRGTKDNRVRVTIIPEYRVMPKVEITYKDEVPTSENSLFYNRTAEITYSFYDLDNHDIQLWTDDYFEHNKLGVTIAEHSEELTLNEGILQKKVSVLNTQTVETSIDYSKLQVNVIGINTADITLEEPPLLPIPEPEPEPPYALIIAVIVTVVLLLVIIVVLFIKSRKKPPVQEEDKPEPSSYSYAGKLNIYITQTQSGYDIPPLSFNLFRLPPGKVISLKEILENCNVSEEFAGAEAIYFKSGANHNLVITNNSDCTVMKNREIMMKKKSYQITPDSKVDITFEDEISELMFQYKELKPSEMW